MSATARQTRRASAPGRRQRPVDRGLRAGPGTAAAGGDQQPQRLSGGRRAAAGATAGTSRPVVTANASPLAGVYCSPLDSGPRLHRAPAGLANRDRLRPPASCATTGPSSHFPGTETPTLRQTWRTGSDLTQPAGVLVTDRAGTAGLSQPVRAMGALHRTVHASAPATTRAQAPARRKVTRGPSTPPAGPPTSRAAMENPREAPVAAAITWPRDASGGAGH